MTTESLFAEPVRVDEPRAIEDYAGVLSQVATEGKPLIVCRNGTDLAAIVPVECLDLLREVAALHELEHRAAQIDWDRMPEGLHPPQQWFDDTDNPFEPEESPRS